MKKLWMLLITMAGLTIGLATTALAAQTVTSSDGVTITVSSRVYKTETITVQGTTQTLYTIPEGTFLYLPEGYGYIGYQYNYSSSSGKYTYHSENPARNRNFTVLEDGAWRKNIFGFEPITFDESGLSDKYAKVFFKQCDRVASDSPFADVTNPSSYFFNATMWGYETGRTTGTDATHFSPSKVCTRAEMVTFLWRAEGSPEPSSMTSPFVDVQDTSKYYYKAVLWAAENGVTLGTDATHFSPNATNSRAEAVTFLFRMYKDNDVIEDNVGETQVNSNWQNKSCPFKDVPTNAFYYDPVRWAYYGEITSGTSSTTFAPAKGCSRAEIITFIYRTACNLQ